MAAPDSSYDSNMKKMKVRPLDGLSLEGMRSGAEKAAMAFTGPCGDFRAKEYGNKFELKK